MLRRYANFASLAMLTSDVACMALVVFTLASLDLPTGAGSLFDQRGNLVPVVLLGLLSLWLCGVHQNRGAGGWQTIRDLLASITIFVGLLTGYWHLFSEPPLIMSDITLVWAMAVAAIGLSRSVGLFCLRLAAPWGLRSRKVLIVGTGVVAQDTARRLQEKAEYGCVVHGFLSEREAEVGRVLNGRPIIGTLGQLATAVESEIDLVILCLSSNLEPCADRLLHDLRNSTVDVKMIPSLASMEAVRMDAYMFEDLPVITLQGSPVHGWHGAGKRALDLGGSALGLCIACPLLAVIAILVKLSSPGPVLYRQVRMSLAGQPFVMLKFRTMHEKAESDTGPTWAIPNDPRVTKIGRLLRKTCLDELPQLWNVLKGEMSLVGPRPERPTYIATFRQAYPAYMLRHKVKAGMTGWAQINGWRGNTCIQKRIAHDLYYIQHWSLWFDLKILCQTLWKGLLHENAY